MPRRIAASRTRPTVSGTMTSAAARAAPSGTGNQRRLPSFHPIGNGVRATGALRTGDQAPGVRGRCGLEPAAGPAVVELPEAPAVAVIVHAGVVVADHRARGTRRGL